MINKQRLAVVIPAHNEAAILGQTLKTLGGKIAYNHVYVVNDGSSDNTRKIARRYTKHVISLRDNVGKAEALNQVIGHYRLYETYDYILPLDADTQLTPGYVPAVLKRFSEDAKLVALVGKVIGRVTNGITAYRVWEYEVGQAIFKTAQDYMGAVVVCPGCATTYRASVFERLRIPQGTLAEDMDLTFMLHREQLGRIGYESTARVITQDPDTWRGFYKQVQRWYAGFWQAVVKHHIPWGSQRLDGEVALLGIEGLFQGMLVLLYLLLLPWTWSRYHTQLIAVVLVDLALFIFPTMLLVKKRAKLRRLLIYVPHIYLLRVISSLIFVYSFAKVVLTLDQFIHWNSPRRYQTAEQN
jgi:poly-beta-1,6-N-acetyl-D-glucosamine synthase